MTKSLARERARSVVATPQAKLKDARRALRAAATLIRDAASMGCMSELTRELLKDMAESADTDAGSLYFRELEINSHQSIVRARRSRKAA